MNSADVEAAVEEFFERLKINPRTKQTQIAKVLEVSSLFYWVDLVDPLGHLSCFIGSSQLFHWVKTVVSLGQLSCFIGSKQLFHWVKTVVLLGQNNCFIVSTLLFDCGSSAVTLDKVNCFFGSTQLYHCDWGGFVPALLVLFVMIQPVQDWLKRNFIAT